MKQVTWSPGNSKNTKFQQIIMMYKCCIIRCKAASNNNKKRPVFSRTEKEGFKQHLLNKNSQIYFFHATSSFWIRFWTQMKIVWHWWGNLIHYQRCKNMKTVNRMAFLQYIDLLHYFWKLPRSLSLQEDGYVMLRKKTQSRVWAKLSRLR